MIEYDANGPAFIDDERIAWSEAAAITYFLDQTYRYEYPGPIRSLAHRLMVAPPLRHGDQARLAERLTIDPPTEVRLEVDRFGNAVARFDLAYLEGTLSLRYRSRLERVATHTAAAISPDDAREALFRDSTALTLADAALRAAARDLAPDGAAPGEIARAACDYVFGEMRYVPDATGVETAAATAFAGRGGVCQDYAHVMLALVRSRGLSARYVSGHLHGEGGTHAWVEVLVREGERTRVLAFDPTHGRYADLRYVVIAVGRDYLDVAPTSGRFVAPYGGALSARKRVGVVAVRYAR